MKNRRRTTMRRSYLLSLIAVQVLACTQPTPKNNKTKSKPSPTSLTSSPSSKEATATNEPTSTEVTPLKDMKLTVAASAPIKEPTPITPQKTDPQCEVQGAALSDSDKEAIFTAYIQIQQEYLEREKGVKNFKLIKDPKEALKYELSFVDLFGNAASMKYKFGKAIVGKDEKTTLCLDEGSIMLWAGTYKRDPAKKFVPDL
jgi:hypothetical protein